jgi:heat-inducible transcriptional repressor
MSSPAREEGSNPKAATPVLNERAQRLLKALVDAYIRSGEPVGSRTLTREAGLSLSSATVRNVMADLEELGFVASPHTSAGRVPTERGYRFFVDTLLKLEPPAAPAMSELERALVEHQDDPKAMIAAASQLLSRITRLAGVVTVPRSVHGAVSQIEFVPLSENRVLAILVTNGREVQNRVLQLERRYGADELRRASQYLSDECRGRSLDDVRAHLLRQMQETRSSMNQAMLDAIRIAERMFEASGTVPPAVEVMIAGETNLMGMPELSNVEKLRRLFEAFNEKRDLLHLLDQCLKTEGVQIFIGHESGYQILDDCTLITAPYATGEGVIGVLGVIGPTRLAYERVIPVVELAARLVGSALNSQR